MTGYVDPAHEQFAAMMKMEDDGPINMLNLVRFREKASYEDGREATGVEAYKTYGMKSGPIFAGVGGKIILSWSPKLTLIGPAEETWDVAFVAEYPNAAAFGKMVQDPAYQEIVFHRQAAVADSRLIRLKPGEAGAIFGS